MRTIMVATIAAAAVTACGPSVPDTQQPELGPAQAAATSAVFPDQFQASYRAEAVMTLDDGAITPVLMFRDGPKMRLEMRIAEAPFVLVRDRATAEGFVITQALSRPVIVPLPSEEAPVLPDLWWDGDMAASMELVGACSHLGQDGAEWQRAHGDGPQHACVTNDGIVLWATINGRTIWQITTLQRGPQDASRFALPTRRVVERDEAEAQGDAVPETYTPPQFNTAPPPPPEGQ